MKILHSLIILVSIISVDSVFAGIPSAYRNIANEEGVPMDILYCIARQESWRPNNKGRPWPWTLNINGTSRYLESKNAAYLVFQNAKKHTSIIDVGLMQINYKWNRNYFASDFEMLDPYTSIRVAAKILKKYYDQSDDWWDAVGRYHSPGKKKHQIKNAQTYRTSVRKKCES